MLCLIDRAFIRLVFVFLKCPEAPSRLLRSIGDVWKDRYNNENEGEGCDEKDEGKSRKLVICLVKEEEEEEEEENKEEKEEREKIGERRRNVIVSILSMSFLLKEVY